MSEILSSCYPPLIQFVVAGIIMWEILNFSRMSIFYDFNQIKISLQKGCYSFADFKKNIQKVRNDEEITLLSIIKAYRWLTPIKLLSAFIVALSLIVIVLYMCIDIFNENVNVQIIVNKSWYFLFSLDAFLLFFRGLSKICYILHALNVKYEKHSTASIILYKYMFGL